jgi:hypothetical protein
METYSFQSRGGRWEREVCRESDLGTHCSCVHGCVGVWHRGMCGACSSVSAPLCVRSHYVSLCTCVRKEHSTEQEEGRMGCLWSRELPVLVGHWPVGGGSLVRAVGGLTPSVCCPGYLISGLEPRRLSLYSWIQYGLVVSAPIPWGL